MSTALSTTASDSYSISSFASQSRLVTVFNVCTVSLQSFDITPPKSFLSIIIMSQPTDDQTVPGKGVVRSCVPLKFCGSNHIAGKAEPKVVKFCTHVGYINSSNRMTYHPQKACGMLT